MASKHRSFVATHRDRYDELLELQRGRCAICGTPPKARRLHIDHDHRTMRLRGLLCHRCNRGLPTWADPDWCDAAAHYLVLPPARLLGVQRATLDAIL